MLEILFIIFLSNKNKANAISRGRKPGMFIGLTIGLWFGLEFLGAFIGTLADMGAGAYGLALLFAIIGGVASYLIAKNCTPGDYVAPEQTMSKAVANAAQPLRFPAQITLVRESSMVGAIVRWDFLLNGQPVGSLGNGNSMTFTTSQRQNILRAKDSYGSEIPPYVFDVADGGQAEIHFKANRFLPDQSKGILASSIPDTQTTPPPVQEQSAFCLRCGEPLLDGAAFCARCGEPRFIPSAAPRQVDTARVWDWPQPADQTAEADALPANPKRAVWAAGLLFVSWILLYLFQGLFHGKLLYNSSAGFLIADAALGAAVYLLLQRRIEHKCAAGVTGLLCVLMMAGSTYALQAQAQFYGGFSLPQVWAFSSPVFWRMLGSQLLIVILTLGAVIGADYLLRERPEGKRLLTISGIAAGVFFVFSLISTFVRIGPTMRYMSFPNVFSLLFSLVADPLILFLAVLFLEQLCTMRSDRVYLHGLGLAWGWIAVFGMFFGLILLIVAGTQDSASINYTSGLLLALAGMAGYILMLCKKRVGFYVLLAGAVLMLSSQLLASLSALMFGGTNFLSQFLGSIFGGINPLLAWLAVRAADRKPVPVSVTQAQPFEPVEQKVHGFHKFAAILILVAGVIFFLLPIPFLIHGDSFVSGMGVCMALGFLVAAYGAWCVAAQQSTKKLYPTWMKVIEIILFIICAILILAILAGLVESI